MQVKVSRSFNLNIPGCYSQFEQTFEVVGEQDEAMSKLDELTEVAYRQYATQAVRIRESMESIDTQFAEELESLREKNSSLMKRVEAGQLFVKSATALKKLQPSDVTEISAHMKETKEYKKLMGIPNEE